MDLNHIPAWLGGIIGAALGFAGREVLRLLHTHREAGASFGARLRSLDQMLKEARALFLSQAEQRDHLAQMLRSNHQAEFRALVAGAEAANAGEDSVLRQAGGPGYDQMFHELSPHFTSKERDLQAMVRGLTFRIGEVNHKMSEWLDASLPLDAPRRMQDRAKGLQEPLERLRLHLGEWDAKFTAIFRDDPRRSLVYLADEEGHGHRFPQDLEPALEAVLRVL